MPIRSVDLNLFRVFEAILRHRSVAAASRELNVTPSAVSHALARLRQLLNDPLFQLTDVGMTPTARALELAPTVSEGLARFAAAIGAREFDAATSGRTFTLAMSDYAATIVLPAILRQVLAKAPNVNLRIFPLSRKDLVEHLDGGYVDMAFGWFNNLPPRMRRASTVEDLEALVVRTGHPLAAGLVTIERLFAYPHIVIELIGGAERPADGFIDEQGVERRVWIERLLLEQESNGSGLVGRVAVSVPHYLAVAGLLECGDMVATLPLRLAKLEEAKGTLKILELPYEPIRVMIEAVWLPRPDRDPGLSWFVAEVAEAVKTLPAIDAL